MHTQANISRTFLGRLQYKDDLLAAVTNFCKEHNVTLGSINVIGAVQNANMGFYDQEQQKYTGCVELNEKLEIAAAIGNISLKDGVVFVHLHAVFADHNGTAFGGHVMPGTIVFAAEFFITELSGTQLVRKLDPATGLPLW